ncbi:MAG: hypothetical protein DHS80DRAFT_7505, partial [Piptocephalis tieghemiana]
VLLGFSDGDMSCADDIDVYTSKLGGVPIWFDQEQYPLEEVRQCGACQEGMPLLTQIYAPLPGSPYERTLLVWACNRTGCSQKPGRWVV